MKKNDRLELIRKIVQENKITTQGELVKLLQNEGLKLLRRQYRVISMKFGITKVTNGRRFLHLWALNCS